MGLFIRSLLIVMIAQSIDGRQVLSSGSHTNFSCDRIVDKLKVLLSDYMDTFNTELRKTKHQVEELKGIVTDTREMVSSQLEETQGKVNELEVAVSALVKLLNNGKLLIGTLVRCQIIRV